MSNEQLVSIIIPTYNRSHLIGKTLDSVLAQTYKNWECIVVDDRSTDDTDSLLMQYCEKDKRFQYHQRPDKYLPGGNGARNYGLKLSRGDYIKWFDSDDLMFPELLELQLQQINKTGCKFSLCQYEIFNKLEGETLTVKPVKLKIDIYLDYITQHLSANLQTLLIAKDSIHGLSLREDLRKGQEYEFLQRYFRLNNQEGAILNKVLVRVIRHKSSITVNTNSEFTTSKLEAILVSLVELPIEAPKFIKNILIKNYLNTLYLSYNYKQTSVFYNNLIKIIKFNFIKGTITTIYLGVLYFVNLKIIDVGGWHYKRIYKIYV